MTVKDFYESIGSDYEAVIARIPSDAMLLKFLKKFPEDNHFTKLCQSIHEKNYSTAYRAAHTLKGLCLSLGFDEMSVPVCELTQQLREENYTHCEEYADRIGGLYHKIIAMTEKL